MKINTFIQQSPIVGIMATQLKLSAYLDKKFGSIGLNYIEAMILAALFFEDKGKSVGPSQLARSILYPLPRVSTALSSLQHKGFVTRELLQADSRKTKLSLSSSGIKKATHVVGHFNSMDDAIGKIVTPSHGTQLNKTLLKLRADVFS